MHTDPIRGRLYVAQQIRNGIVVDLHHRELQLEVLLDESFLVPLVLTYDLLEGPRNDSSGVRVGGRFQRRIW